MIKNEPILLLDNLVFPEGPRWHDNRLWFSDMQAGAVFAIDMSGNCERIVQLNDSPSGLGWFPNDDRLLIVSMGERKLLRHDPVGMTVFADLRQISTYPCNDMVVSPQGNAYIGNFGFLLGTQPPAPTHLIMVRSNGETLAVGENLIFPNGMVITEDGATLIVAETFGNRLTAFDIQADGSLQRRRTWAELTILPDGICLDAQGCIWAAMPQPPGGFVRVAEGGEIRDRIDTGDRCGYACMLGGPEHRTLFLLEAFTHEPAAVGNGRIRMLEVDVPKAGYP